MSKLWEGITYTDKLTALPLGYEVVPMNDSRRHISSPDCACLPEIHFENGMTMLVHNAFDGRELAEEGNEERGN